MKLWSQSLLKSMHLESLTTLTSSLQVIMATNWASGAYQPANNIPTRLTSEFHSTSMDQTYNQARQFHTYAVMHVWRPVYMKIMPNLCSVVPVCIPSVSVGLLLAQCRMRHHITARYVIIRHTSSSHFLSGGGWGVKPIRFMHLQLVGNVDITPTLLEIAGIESSPNDDGHSFASTLMNSSSIGNWRESMLIEYYSVGTYYNDHSAIWSSPSSPAAKCETKAPPRGPTNSTSTCSPSDVIGGGNCYMIDSTYSNTWRLLRTLNQTNNFAYIEYSPKRNWTNDIIWYEYYDLNKDPYQLQNSYSSLQPELKDALHVAMDNYYACSGASCP
eukprot:m.109211 g.109211  ORF g.109211 m.109211 type:complete len:329 (-) comp13368_c0_seq3:1254-2240(-)